MRAWRVLGGHWLALAGEARRISASVRGDDVFVKASREDAELLIQKFKDRYDDRRSRGSRQAAPDPQQNGAMEFPRAVDRSRPAPCKRGDQSLGTQRCRSSTCARSGGQGERPGSKTTKRASTPIWGMRSPPCSVPSQRAPP